VRSLAALRRRTARPTPEERCDLCAAKVPEGHRHLLEIATKRLACACHACALLFPAQASARYKEVPTEMRRLDGFAPTDAEWDALMIPINIAFFVRDSARGKTVAFYPSPAGAMESALDIDAWSEVPLREDVEALLINRLRRPAQSYILPIDACYRLVGLVRKHWRGLSGGEEMRDAVDRFFAEVSGA
jgi:hypothetical protein